MEVNGQPHAPAALSPGIDHMVPIEWEAGWASDPVWTFLGKDNSVPSAGI